MKYLQLNYSAGYSYGDVFNNSFESLVKTDNLTDAFRFNRAVEIDFLETEIQLGFEDSFPDSTLNNSAFKNLLQNIVDNNMAIDWTYDNNKNLIIINSGDSDVVGDYVKKRWVDLDFYVLLGNERSRFEISERPTYIIEENIEISFGGFVQSVPLPSTPGFYSYQYQIGSEKAITGEDIFIIERDGSITNVI